MRELRVVEKEGFRIHEITCDKALNRVSGRFPYHWDLNAYRGCEHGCQYCYALYSHQYLNANDYFDDRFVKTNIVERLERQLQAKSWQREVVNLGGVTDNYQSIEAEYQLMPEIWRLLIKYKTPAIVSTKSTLILRDFDLIDELSRSTYVNVAATITAMDESLRQKLEPRCATSLERFEMLKAFRKTNASVGVHMMPSIPYLSDNLENLEGIYANAKAIGAHYVLPCLLNLRGQTKLHFMEFLRQEYPSTYYDLWDLYKSGHLDRAYSRKFYEKIAYLRNKYQVSGNYNRYIKEKMPKANSYEQLTLF